MIPFRTTAFRAFGAYLWTLASSISGFVFVVFLLRPFVLEAFQVPTNAMAPHHIRATCPECGRPCYSSEDKYRRNDEPSPMICEAFHVTDHTARPKDVHPGDRILVSKFVAPRRWDVIVFRFPEDPRVNYVKRLVGLPGETIYIKEGAIWVNDQRLEMPAELTGLTYLAELPDQREPMWGTEQQPAVLGGDQYFVLGDFSARSYDSRLWHQSDPDRPSYAVPRSHLIGVVATTYWPPRRWRSFR
jgi:signal peptidase I